MRIVTDVSELRRKVEEWRAGIPKGRTELVKSLAETFRRRVGELTPVRTGRARRGWGAGGDSAETGASPASGELEGSADTVSADSQGSKEMLSNDGPASLTSNDGNRSVADINNNVPYIGYLEYGTRRMRARAMARRALAEVAAAIRQVGGGGGGS